MTQACEESAMYCGGELRPGVFLQLRQKTRRGAGVDVRGSGLRAVLDRGRQNGRRQSAATSGLPSWRSRLCGRRRRVKRPTRLWSITALVPKRSCRSGTAFLGRLVLARHICRDAIQANGLAVALGGRSASSVSIMDNTSYSP
jgi:hypothetical protein